MPLKLKNTNNLSLGSIYCYELSDYLIVRSDYEKSKGYEIKDINNLDSIVSNSIKNFYNEDSTLKASPILKKKKASSIKIGEYIIQDGLIYILTEISKEELIFVDYPKSNCPIYFFAPFDSQLEILEGYKEIGQKENLFNQLNDLVASPKKNKTGKTITTEESEKNKITA